MKNVYLFKSLITIMLMLGIKSVSAQNSMPRHYWTFEGSTGMADSMNNSALNPTYYQCIYSISPSSQGSVGKSLALNGSGRIIVAGSNLQLDSSVTIEFLFKAGPEFNLTEFIKRRDNGFLIKMGYPFIQFTTNLLVGSSTVNDNFTINLEGIGRGSYGYYVDNKWHHIVFKYNGSTGTKEIWVDGQLPAGFSKTIAKGKFNPNTGNTNNNTVDINSNTSYYKFYGNIDEIALYNIALPSTIIYKHNNEAKAGNHYSFGPSSVQPPVAAPVTSGIDLNEFMPGHPNPSITASEQLRSYPLPRYKPGHNLLSNFNWIGLNYFGGYYQPGVSTAQAVSNTVSIQTELAKNWNYSVLVSGNTSTYSQYSDATKFHGAWVQLANQNPSWPAAAISFWNQLNPSAAGYSSNTGYIENKNLPNSYYLKNSSGQYLTTTGSVSSSKIISPASPLDSIRLDGLTQRFYMQSLVNSLTRPLNFISENAEVIPKASSNALSLDPAVVADKNSSGLDWDTYVGNRKTRQAKMYRDQFMSLPQLANTKYAEYQISGHPVTRHKYSETRTIQTAINGKHYATPDFYPRWPGNWYTGAGPWNGWKHIIDGRYYELQAGDALYSPFVAAGWNEDEERNIRPAQWLGLLKAIAMTGAEFYYTGFFNENSSYNPPNPAPANPAGYAWQAAMPSYAQAITSRYQDLLRNGSLLPGDAASYTSNPNIPLYSFNAGDQRKLVIVRKHNSQNIFAITGTLQPNSNMTGNAELEGEATIRLNNQVLKFNVRRQGSTFLYDNTNPASPVFVQLDGWHEATHPYRWSKDFNLEAELFDNTPASVVTKTTVPQGTVAGDFRNFVTHVSTTVSSGTFPTLEYNFTPRNSPNYYFWVRARSKNGTPGGMNVLLNGQNQKTIGCISDTAWNWYSIQSCNGQAISFTGLANQNQKLGIMITSASIEIDKILLSIDPFLNLNANQAACGGAVAVVTSSGPLNFCQGGSVTLTAPSGISYQWSGGQTTQSITVNTTGTYTVSVSNGTSCNSISSPVNVTVLSKPTPLISANGSSNICSGQSVMLTASAGNSYQWSNGATTQSVNISTAGNYQVTVTNSNGCTGTSPTHTVTQNTIPVPVINVSGSTTFCDGSYATLSAPAGYSYQWSNGKTTQTINAYTAGSYSVTVTSGAGCSSTSQAVNINVLPAPVAALTANGPLSFCSSSSVSLSASGGVSYAWSNGANTPTIQVNASGIYSATVTNNNGCTSESNSVYVDVLPAPQPVITVNGPLTLTSGQTTTLKATGGVVYFWQPGGQPGETLVVSTPGTYSVVAVDNNGCTGTSSNVTINGNTTSAVSIQASGSTSFCEGGNVTLNATGGANYLWSPGGSTSPSITVSQSGTYYLYSRDAMGSVTGMDSIAITVSSTPMSPDILVTYIPGSAYQLKAFEPSAVKYLWSNNSTSQTINCTSAQTLTVRSENAFGCISDVRSITVANPQDQNCKAADMLSYNNASDTSVNLQWNPARTGLYFKVIYWETGSQVMNEKELNGNITSAYLNNLNPAADYSWKVVTMCNDGKLYTSSISSFRTLNGPLSCGSQPIHTGVIAVNTKNATLKWYSTNADSFRIRFRAAGETTYKHRMIPSTAVSGTKIQGLNPATTYEWQVQSICNGYSSPFTQPSYFTTLDTCGWLGELSVADVALRSATVKWEETTPMDTIRIRITNMATGTIRRIILTENPVNTSWTINSLKPNTTYQVDVKGFCPSGAKGDWSNIVTFTTGTQLLRATDDNPLALRGFPIPATDLLNYTFVSDEPGDYTLKVSDMSGRQLIQTEKYADKGSNDADINVSNYAKGVYLLIIQKGTLTSRFRFTVQ